MADEVAVTITADASQVKKEIDASIAALAAFGRNVNVFNATAVRAFRDSASAEKELNESLGASVQQMQHLASVTETFERRIDSADVRTARATERMGRGFSMLARSGEDSARSMNTILTAGADLAFSFGPEGPLLAAVFMVAAGIAGHFEKAEERMEAISAKFTHHLDEMLASGSAIESARTWARAYVDELEAGATLIAKKQKEARMRALLGDAPWAWGLSAMFAGTGAAKEKLDLAQGNTVSSGIAEQATKTYEVHDKELTRLEKRRSEANADIARATEQIAALKGKDKDNELAAARRDLTNAEARLQKFEQRTRDLEAERLRLAGIEAGTLLSPASREALLFAARSRTPADLAAEHEARTDQISRGADTAGIAQARYADVEAQKLFTAQLHEATRVGTAILREIDSKLAKNETAERVTGDLHTQLQDRLSIAKQGDDLFTRRIEQANKEKDILDAQVERDSENLMDVGERLRFRTKEHAEVKAIYDLTVKQIEVERQRGVDKAIAGVRGKRDPFEQQADTEKAVHDRATKARAITQDKGELTEIGKREAEGVRDAWFKMVDDVTSKGADGFDRLAQAMQNAGIAGAGAAKFAGDAIRRFRIAAIGAEAAIEARKEYAAVFKSLAEHDPFGATMHGIAAAGYAATAVAAGVAAVSPSGGGSGTGGARAGLGASFGGGSSNTPNMIKIEIVNVTKDQSGRETTRTRQMIQRQQDLNYPIRVGGLG